MRCSNKRRHSKVEANDAFVPRVTKPLNTTVNKLLIFKIDFRYSDSCGLYYGAKLTNLLHNPDGNYSVYHFICVTTENLINAVNLTRRSGLMIVFTIAYNSEK